MKTRIRKRIQEKVGQPGFETQRLLLSLSEKMAEKLTNRDMSRAQLAEAMGVDRAAVTRVLSGSQNVTLRTVVTMAAALGCRLVVDLDDFSMRRAEAQSKYAARKTESVEIDMSSQFNQWLDGYPEPETLLSSHGLTREESW